jgi:hypothetical protein
VKKRRILNLGAGTQSSVLLVMADRGEIEPVEVAVFADTQAEPQEVYDHLNWLEKQVRIPVARVTMGNLETDTIEFRRGSDKRHSSIPLFVLNPDGTRGMARRQCTYQYKIRPIERYIRREILGLKPRQRIPKGTIVEQVFGISFDERSRCKNGKGDPAWMKRDYPLVDRMLNRQQVIEVAERWFPGREFPRSACVFCPFKPDSEWKRMRDRFPSEWRRAVQFDHDIRSGVQAGSRKMLRGKPFIHDSLKPLDEADLRSDDERAGQLTLYGLVNECEGMCGV